MSSNEMNNDFILNIHPHCRSNFDYIFEPFCLPEPLNVDDDCEIERFQAIPATTAPQLELRQQENDDDEQEVETRRQIRQALRNGRHYSLRLDIFPQRVSTPTIPPLSPSNKINLSPRATR
jgi:hypothetical protein